ncbi:MAG: nucleotidyltransferase domain-containing protein [archaeon]
MVTITDERVIKELNKLINKLKKKIKIEKVILFGSRARGDNFIHSDIDIIIVSDDFSGMKFADRIYRILELWDYEISLEPFCYTNEEFKRKSKEIGIVNQAVIEGKEIAAA